MAPVWGRRGRRGAASLFPRVQKRPPPPEGAGGLSGEVTEQVGSETAMQDSNGSGPQASETQIPVALKSHARWIPWQIARSPLGRATKKPEGSTLNPEHWSAWDRLAATRVTPSHGIGFVLTGRVETPEGTLVALDCDACRNPQTGALEPWASALFDAVGRSYTEITPSGAGLRIWLFVQEPPDALPVIRVPFPAPPGVDKTPEIQTFGLGAAGYVTVTGQLLPGASSEILSVPSLSYLTQTFRAQIDAPAVAKVPKGSGPAPSVDVALQRLLESPNGDLLVKGQWQHLGCPSASEAWWRLVRATLRACEDHFEVAVELLRERTAFGAGQVDSRDPDRYRRMSWVRRDVARVAGKAQIQPAEEVFADGFDPIAWTPPKVATAGWVVPFEEFRRGCSEQRFLYYNLLPAQGLVQLFGDPSCGKTPLAISLALHVALGLDWFGHECEESGAVVYMIGEDPTGVRDRVEAQITTTCAQHGADPPSLADLPFFLTTRPGALSEPGNRRRWIEEIRKATTAPIRLLVVDTQSRNFGPGNENATEDMGRFIGELEAIRATLGCLVLLVHHTGHLAKDRGRGSSSLPAALDAQFEVQRNGKAVVASPRKAKNWKEPEPLVGTLVVQELGIDAKGRPVTAISLEDRPPEPGEVFQDGEDDEMLRLLGAVQELKGEKTTQSALGDAIGVSRPKVQRLLRRAEELGLVERGSAKGAKRSYTLTEQGLATNLTPSEQLDEPDGKNELQNLLG